MRFGSISGPSDEMRKASIAPTGESRRFSLASFHSRRSSQSITGHRRRSSLRHLWRSGDDDDYSPLKDGASVPAYHHVPVHAAASHLGTTSRKGSMVESTYFGSSSGTSRRTSSQPLSPLSASFPMGIPEQKEEDSKVPEKSSFDDSKALSEQLQKVDFQRKSRRHEISLASI